MKILKSKREKNKFFLEIEESPEVITKALSKAFHKVVKDAKAPGFRKGKVPRDIFEKQYGKEIIEQEAIMIVVNEAYWQALNELKLEVVDMPQNFTLGKYEEGKNFKFSCDVEVKPIVKLGKYKGLKVKKKSTDISEEQVSQEIENLQKSRTEYLTETRPSQKEDLVNLDIEASIDNQNYENWTKKNTRLFLNSNSPYGQEFENTILGLKKEDIKNFVIKYPKNFSIKDIAKKEVHFKVTILEVKSKKVPALTDEFIAQNTPFKTLTELKTQVRKNLEAKAKTESEKKLHEDIMTAVINNIKMDIPEPMINHEIDHMLKYFEWNLKQSGMSLDKYMSLVGKTQESLKAELKENAIKKIQSQLALEAIALTEKIESTEEEINTEIQTIAAAQKTKPENIHPEDVKAALSNKKTYDFLIENAKIN
ncbi:trigger factor [bacterium]|nr:trigger factor [bacterium]MBT4552735.1 trigger factor [bacterium]MBT7088451.1 trigger factor [bacterium]